MKDGQEIGVLEAATTGSYLTGETSAALGISGGATAGDGGSGAVDRRQVAVGARAGGARADGVLGQMAASVSHNLRNPLSSMKTVLQVQLENPDLPLDVRRDCTLVVSEIDRMSAKLTQLLRYAKPSVNGERVAAVAVATQTALLFGRDAERRNVRLEFEKPTHEIFAQASEDGAERGAFEFDCERDGSAAGGRACADQLSRYDGRLDIVWTMMGREFRQSCARKFFSRISRRRRRGRGWGFRLWREGLRKWAGRWRVRVRCEGGRGLGFI